jgi:hypothetical protein
MANLQAVKRAPITLALDKERTLKFTLNSFATMEDRYGTVDDAMKAMDSGSMKAIRFLLWVGLIHEDKTLTEEIVGDLISMEDMEMLANKLNQGLDADGTDENASATALANPNA